MDVALRAKIVQAMDLLDEIDDWLNNEIVLTSPDSDEEFSFFGLSLMLEKYLEKNT